MGGEVSYRYLLLVRAGDMVALGVELVDFGPGPEPGTLVSGPEATLGFWFPPQAIGEQKTDRPVSVDTPPAKTYAEQSFVLCTPPVGSVVAVTATAVLELAARSRQWQPEGLTLPDGPGTALEIPQGLWITPLAVDGDLRLVHQPTGEGDRRALWSTRFVATGPLSALPSRASSDGFEGGASPLSEAERNAIVVRTAQTGVLPRVDRLELSALGGSLRAGADWTTLRWQHEVALGRDQKVSLLRTGALYPTGHRAELSSYAERRFAPDAAGQPVAELHVRHVLRVLEPVRRFPAEDSAASRSLPFEELEITRLVYPELVVPDVWDDQWLASSEVSGPYQQVADDLRREKDELRPVVDRQLAERQAAGAIESYQVSEARNALASAQYGAADARSKAADWTTTRDDIARQQIEVEKQLERIDIDEGTRAELMGRSTELAQRLSDLGPQPDVAGADRAVVDAERALAAAQAAYPTNYPPASVDGLGTPESERHRDLRDHLVPQAQAAADAVKLPVNRSFQPTDGTGMPIAFPVRGTNPAGPTSFSLPMRFVADIEDRVPTTIDGDPAYATWTDTDLPALQQERLAGAGVATLPGARLDLVGSSSPRPGDVFEVSRLALAADATVTGFRPRVTAVQVTVPSLTELLPHSPPVVDAVFNLDFLRSGEGATAVLDVAGEYVAEFHDQLPGAAQRLVADFSSNADRAGALVSPTYAVNALSRELGPVNLDALPGAAAAVSEVADVFADAKVLGVRLLDLLDELGKGGPRIEQLADALTGRPPTVTMTWDGVRLGDHPPFRSVAGTALSARATVGPDGQSTHAELSAFSLELPPGSPLLRVDFERLSFEQTLGGEPDLSVAISDVAFLDGLGLLEKIQDHIALVDSQKLVTRTPDGVRAAYSLLIPSVDCVMFQLRGIDLRAAVDIPFSGEAVTLTLGVSSRERPFGVSVGTFGGSGYLELVLNARGLQRFEAQLDFGAQVSLSLGPVSGELHALGGVRYLQLGSPYPTSITCTGFVRLGGSVDIFDLVSLSVELVVELAYRSATKSLTGRACLVIEVDLGFWSDSIELDSGTWTLAGGSGTGAGAGVAPDSALDRVTGVTVTTPAPPAAPGTTTDEQAWQIWWEGFNDDLMER